MFDHRWAEEIGRSIVKMIAIIVVFAVAFGIVIGALIF